MKVVLIIGVNKNRSLKMNRVQKNIHYISAVSTLQSIRYACIGYNNINEIFLEIPPTTDLLDMLKREVSYRLFSNDSTKSNTINSSNNWNSIQSSTISISDVLNATDSIKIKYPEYFV